jgi:hypothetical protein
LHALCPLVPSNIDGNPSDVAAWPCHARGDASLDWIADEPDDRNQLVEIWIPTNYLTREVRIRSCTSFAGISLDQEIAPFDIA